MRPAGVDFFAYRRSTQWAVCLLAVWFLLNFLDLATTYQALSTGRAIELNPFMALLIGVPVLAITTKMLLAYAAAKIVEKMDSRSSYYSILSLLMLDIYVALICAHNMRVCLGI